MKWLPQLLISRAVGSDEQAMRRVRELGDHAAFTQLVARWDGPIRRLCVRMTGDEHRGEDLAQEAFARVFTHRHQFDPSRRFSTWLWRIALNLCHEESRRRAGRRGEIPLETSRHDSALRRAAAERAPVDLAQASERAERVRQALSMLPTSHRAVVVLREYEGLKFREIAEVLGEPEGTVKWRMSEALDQLRRQLTSIGAEDVAAAVPAPRAQTRTAS